MKANGSSDSSEVLPSKSELDLKKMKKWIHPDWLWNDPAEHQNVKTLHSFLEWQTYRYEAWDFISFFSFYAGDNKNV